MLDQLESISTIKALIVFCVTSFAGMGVIALKARKAVKEISEAVAMAKWTFTKYRGFIKSEAVCQDLNKLKDEFDEALEAVADVVEKFHGGAARRLRDAI
jgi:hypothetical protein